MSKDAVKYLLYILFHLEMLNDPVTSTAMQNFLKNTLVYKSKRAVYGAVGNGENGGTS